MPPRFRTAVLGLLVIAASGRLGAAPPGEGKAGDVIASFPCDPRKGWILLPVTLGDQTYDFALDTGAEISVFDIRLRPILGEPIGEIRVNSTVRAETYRWPESSGKLAIGSGRPVVCLDLTGFREGSGQEFSGVIGMDVLESKTFRIDPDRGEILFLRGPIGPPPLLAAGFPIEIRRGRPFVKADLGGLGEVDFLLDTGFLGNARSLPEDFPRLASSGRARRLEAGLTWGVSGVRDSGFFAPESLTIDGHRLEWPILSEAEPGKERLLGLEVLSRFRATFDLAGRRLHLEEARRFKEPWVYSLSGAYLDRRGGETVVTHVGPASAARDAGIDVGDVILMVGGTPANDLTLWEVDRLFSRAGSSHRLRIRKKSGEVERTLTLGK